MFMHFLVFFYFGMQSLALLHTTMAVPWHHGAAMDLPHIAIAVPLPGRRAAMAVLCQGHCSAIVVLGQGYAVIL